MSSIGSTPVPRVDARSRVIHLDAGQLRDRGQNLGTVVHIGFDLRAVQFRVLFGLHYRAIRAMARANVAPGLAIVLVHSASRQLAARAWLAARADGVASAIVGRHSDADVLLEDPAIALRHLAILIGRARSWDAHELAYEIVDLRTQSGFADERGDRLEAASCDGPAFITCGAYAAFLLQTGDPTDWPDDADQAWAMLPERVMKDERAAEPDRWRRGAHRAAAPRTQSCVTSIPGLLAPEARLLSDGETPAGHLYVCTAVGARLFPVGERALARGILMGRYARCDGADLFTDHRLSRAHVLVKRIDGRVFAIDTASTDGIYREGSQRRERAIDLDQEGALVLGSGFASIRWQP